MDPNEPFDYDRLDALLRDIGYAEPDETGAPAQQPQPPQQQPVRSAPRSQAAANTQPQSAAQQAVRQQRAAQQGYASQYPNQHPNARQGYPQQAYPQQGYQQGYPQNYQPGGQPVRRAQAQPPAAPPPNARRPQAQYAQPEPPQKPKKKKKHRFLKFLLSLLLLLVVLIGAAAFVVLRTNAGQPKSGVSLGARKDGCSTILLAGTDAGGTRTDTIMLCTLNTKDSSVSLLSIPRDTLVNDSYSVPKINGTYGVYGCGEDGMAALMDAVEKLVGFRPDGYVLIDLDGFVDLVDLMGGVEFDVPVDMHYSDPSQDLYIDLDAGVQTLNGEQAMGVVRFRSTYAMADLDRISVQRAFLSACMEQWATPKNVLKAPKLLPLVLESVTTDLTTANLAWCAGAVLRCDTAEIAANTLPGSASNWNGGSYYIEAPYDTVELVNELYNPYIADVTIYDLDVRTP